MPSPEGFYSGARSEYSESNRIGDHIWWISDLSRFQSHYPDWQLIYTVKDILAEIYQDNIKRWN